MTGKSAGVKNKNKKDQKDDEVVIKPNIKAKDLKEEEDIKPNIQHTHIRFRAQLRPVKSGTFKRKQQPEIGRRQVETTSGISPEIGAWQKVETMSGMSSEIRRRQAETMSGMSPEIGRQEVDPTTEVSSAAADQEDEEEEDNEPKSSHINVMIKAQDGTEVAFSIKRTTPLQKLMKAYCDHKSVVLGSYAFLTDEGKRFYAEQTPNEVGLEDGAVLDAFLHQSGGGVRCDLIMY